MKIFIKSFTLLVFTITLMAMQVKPKRIVFFGDSITQLGINKGGYIDLIKQQLDPMQYELLGAGVGGDKVYDLYLRLEDDVLQKKPDLVLIYVGINDVWHKLGARTGTDYAKYLKFYQALINKIQASGSKIVLCTPTVIGEQKDGSNEVDSDLNTYAAGVRELAIKNKLPLCDLRKAFLAYEATNNLENKEKGVLTTDRVHLNAAGNKLVAETMLPFIK